MTRATLIFTLIAVLFSASTLGEEPSTRSSILPSVPEFFQGIEGNLTKVTWDHAVNSQQALTNALNSSDIMMLEADVVWGTLESEPTVQLPVMAHPPANTSDLSLEDFLSQVMADQSKGAKLDFKSLEAFSASCEILQKLRDNMTFPVWLNADILDGPVNSSLIGEPVNATQFLSLAAETLPNATLSLGWKTRYGADYNIIDGSYSEANVEEMINTIKNVSQPITYPMRAGLVANSWDAIDKLLNESASGTTVTIWSSDNDTVDDVKLSEVIQKIGVSKVYIDVPEELMNRLHLESSTSSRMKICFGTLLAALLFAKFF
ncbi:protein FAM151A isoform X1 [Neodiprion virginianus]|uniref:protein FAM151A isoform X1 n=1 Tax=Neodiprion virginianus TaxID=2961670 RepID=UPI001EE6D7C3|nr:protein FAM151A isoform X1 [Neodiprion virginianus]